MIMLLRRLMCIGRKGEDHVDGIVDEKWHVIYHVSHPLQRTTRSIVFIYMGLSSPDRAHARYLRRVKLARIISL
jgi:hypothetical protein